MALVACSPTAAPTPPANETTHSPSPEVPQAADFALDPGVRTIAKVSGGRTSIDLGRIKPGTVHIVIECRGQGTVSYTYGSTGSLPVPCSPDGFVTYNEAVFFKDKKNLILHFTDGGQSESVRALIGWSPKLSKPPQPPKPNNNV